MREGDTFYLFGYVFRYHVAKLSVAIANSIEMESRELRLDERILVDFLVWKKKVPSCQCLVEFQLIDIRGSVIVLNLGGLHESAESLEAEFPIVHFLWF